MRSLGDVLIWFVAALVVTIGLGYIAILTKIAESTLRILAAVFYILIIIDGVLFITLVVLIINSAKKDGF